MQYLHTELHSVPLAHVVPLSASGVQHDEPLFGPSRQRPLSDADEQLDEDDDPDEEDEEVAPLVPPEEVPPEVVPPELEPPPSSDEEQAATVTRRRRAEETEAMRAMFMPPRHGPEDGVAPNSNELRRFLAQP